MVVVVCTAFDFTVSEAKTKIMCLLTKRMSESTAIFSVEAATRDLSVSSFVLFIFCLLGVVAYSEYSVPLPFPILYGEYFVRFPCRCFFSSV